MQEVLVSKIFNYTSTPTKNVEGQFWFNPSTNVLSRFNGTVWKPITVSSDDVAVLTDGSTVSLTSYLNTQIAALAEGIDSKQDKLLYYSEVSGDTPSATISVANIKLDGKVAEGNNTKASGIYSHAEGQNTSASGSYSHTEGSFTSASGNYSHVEGSNTKALSIYQHVQGKYNIEDANDKYADIIGNGTSISARSNAATVSWDGISWSQSDVRAGGTDQDNATYSLSALAEDIDSKQDKLLYYSETPGFTPSVTISVANINFRGSVAEGDGTTASGYYSHAEGNGTNALGYCSHAEGNRTNASGYYSHAEGSFTTASGYYSHVEGNRTNALGQYSHAEGSFTTASAFGSHAEGYHTITSSDYQHAQGKYNIEDVNDKYADIIGNGSADDSRSNAQTVSWTGITWSQTDVRAGGADQDAATHSLAAKQNATDNSLETTDKTIVGAINELSANKQNTLKYFSESDSSTEPSSNNAQVSILKTSDYQGTLNLGFESSNGIQTINIGGSSNDRRINIGTKTCGSYNNVTIGNASDGVLLTLNTGRGLAGTGVTKDLSTSATDAQFPTAAAVNNQLILKQNITDNTLTTTAKTIVGAINELKTATDAMVVVSTDNAINVAPTTAQTGVLIASSKTNGGNVIITPKITNTGACYLSTSSTYSNLNPIYPDPTNNKYTYPNLGTVYLFVDNAGDSADIVIENFAG